MSDEAPKHARAATWLRRAGLVGILAIIVARTWIAFAPDVVFDVDPARDGGSMGALGPAGSLLLDVVLLVSVALGFGGEALGGKRVHRRLIGLALLPMLVVLWHGLGDAGDLVLGAAWVSSAAAAVALAHLCRDPGMRAAVIGVLAAALMPLLARGALQMTTEHMATLAAWDENGAAFLADRGWGPDSPAALIFERRLRQPQPTGWFPTANVYATIVATAFVLWGGLAIGAARGGLQTGFIGLAGLVVAASGAALVMTGARAGIGAAVIGAAVLALPFAGRLGQRVAARGGPLLGALILLALLAVVVRGTTLPEGLAGERSLLFRWHYMAGACQVMIDEAPLGAGPDGFQEAYVKVRSPRSPEEVSSAHSIGADWLATLGIGGLVLIGLAVSMICGAGRHAAAPVGPDPDDPIESCDPRTALIAVPCCAVLAALLALPVEAATIPADQLTVRVLGIAAFIATGLVAAMLFRAGPRAWMEWSLVAAAATMLVHVQVELTGVQVGAVGFCWAVLGVLARPRDASPRRLLPELVPSLVVAAVAIVIFVVGALPAVRQARGIRAAAVALVPRAEDSAAAVRQRIDAVDLLIDAYETWPANDRPLGAAIRQSMLAAGIDPARRWVHVERAAALADRFVVEHGGLRARVVRSSVLRERARLLGGPDAWSDALDGAETVVRLDPHAIGPWLALGDAAWEAGERARAAEAYRRALANSAAFELDPLKQIADRDRGRAVSRIESAGDPVDQ